MHLGQAFVLIQWEITRCREVTGQFPAAAQGAGDYPPHLGQGTKHRGSLSGERVEKPDVQAAVAEPLGHVRPGVPHEDQAHAPIPAQTPA